MPSQRSSLTNSARQGWIQAPQILCTSVWQNFINVRNNNPKRDSVGGHKSSMGFCVCKNSEIEQMFQKYRQYPHCYVSMSQSFKGPIWHKHVFDYLFIEFGHPSWFPNTCPCSPTNVFVDRYSYLCMFACDNDPQELTRQKLDVVVNAFFRTGAKVVKRQERWRWLPLPWQVMTKSSRTIRAAYVPRGWIEGH